MIRPIGDAGRARHRLPAVRQAAQALNRPAEALADWERALELDDGSMRTRLRLTRALALAKAGEPAKALVAGTN